MSEKSRRRFYAGLERILEVNPQNDLELAIRARANLIRHGLGEGAEGPTGCSLGVRQTGLNYTCCIVQPRDPSGDGRVARNLEHRVVQNVVALRAEFDILIFLE